MPVTLYYDLLSQPARTTYIFMKANKVEFRGTEIDLQKGEQKGEQYKELSFFGRVPLLDEDGFRLTE
ncbi:glutathione s-transferase theta, partial [Plakobranchus ocellatus]